jgi:two-component sensor histidine kinase
MKEHHTPANRYVWIAIAWALMTGVIAYVFGIGVRGVGLCLVLSAVPIWIVWYLERRAAYAAKQLQTVEDENTFLLKEMHHRIKNNMQVMMGLLETQSFKIHDPKYKRMFENHVDRIKAMSYLHQNLYDEKSRDRIDMHEYLGSIIRNLQLMTSNTIQVKIDPCQLDMQQALNVGLIVNEAVSNAIKYAYDDFDGTIDVTLTKNGRQCTLHVQDFGKGYDPQTLGDETLGVSMIEDMAAFLNDSSVTVNSRYGVSIVVTFTQGE